MTELELRANALISELASQRNIFGDRAANLAVRVAELEAQVADLRGKVPKEESDKPNV